MNDLSEGSPEPSTPVVPAAQVEQPAEEPATTGVHGASPALPEETVKSAPFILGHDPVGFQQVLFSMPTGEPNGATRQCALYVVMNESYKAELIGDLFKQNSAVFPENMKFTLGEKFESREKIDAYLRENAIKNKDGRFHWWPPLVLSTSVA